MNTFSQPISRQLRAVAIALPETSEGTSCVNRAFKVRKKNFLFLGEKEKDAQVKVMLKLGPSLAAAAALDDARVDISTNGWMTVRFAYDDPPDADMLSGWVVESFRLLAPKTVGRRLDQHSSP